MPVSDGDVAIPLLTGVTAEDFRERLHPARRPCILRGMDLGPCTERWKDSEYIKSKCPEAQST
jgi:hypothetical protein